MNEKATPDDCDGNDSNQNLSMNKEEGNLKDSNEEGDEINLHNDELCKVNGDEHAHECNSIVLDFGNGEIFHLDSKQAHVVF